MFNIKLYSYHLHYELIPAVISKRDLFLKGFYSTGSTNCDAYDNSQQCLAGIVYTKNIFDILSIRVELLAKFSQISKPIQNYRFAGFFNFTGQKYFIENGIDFVKVENQI